MARRKHRKVKGVPPGWKGCRCPKGSRRVSTCSVTKKGEKVCNGRGWGCLGTGPSQKGKPSPRFVKALCPSPPPDNPFFLPVPDSPPPDADAARLTSSRAASSIVMDTATKVKVKV